MTVPTDLFLLAAVPTPGTLRQLQARLLSAGIGAAEPVWLLLDAYYEFLTALAARATSREFSHFASLLDIGAVGSVALQNVLLVEKEDRWWQRLLAGGLSEGLMVLAARQYVRAWEGEMGAVYAAAGWRLYRQLWHVSARLQPALPAEERRRLLDDLLAPLAEGDLSGTQRAILATRLFQLLLLVRLQWAFPEPAGAA
ncbi:MAG: hypothetical protein RRC07_16110 [Anaerolineae bacterium]|nr:hypothetical protein [Anaerolineae bacterium]